MNDLREHAIYLLIHGEEDMDYWHEEAANDARLDDLRDKARAAAAKRPELSPAEQGLDKLGVGPKEAAWIVGVSLNYFEKHVLPLLKTKRIAGRRIIPLAELKRFIEGIEHAESQ